MANESLPPIRRIVTARHGRGDDTLSLFIG